MIKAWWMVLCFGCVSAASFGQARVLYTTETPPGFATALLPKSALQADMKWWQTVMEESHVNLYHAISKQRLEQLEQHILDALPDSVTHFQSSFAMSELIGSLNEGHLGFASDRVSDSLYAYEALRFPYLLSGIDNGALVVQQDLSQVKRLPAFSRIIAINGMPVQQLYDRYSKFYGGLEPWKKLMVMNNIRKLLYMDGIRSPFGITALVGKDTIRLQADGYTRKQADSLTAVMSAALPAMQPFSLRFLDNNIAYIEFNTMNGTLRDSFSRFLYHSFDSIHQRNAAGVIVDLRKNGGGDSGLGDSLISYISGKPYRSASGMKMRISKHSKAFAVLLNANDPFKDWKNGSLYEYDEKELNQPDPNPLRYNGKVAVLIGTGTFSSANMLTNAIKDYQLATLIGESTAEPANDFGEIFSFMLPNTHIIARGAIKMFMRANGDTKDFGGIHPDIEVRRTSTGKDEVLDRAVKWIRE